MALTSVLISAGGRVQQVWFRESTRQMAESLGLAGWVRNLDGGRVEALFEGPEDKVAEAVEWARHGPEHALVTEFQEHTVKLTGATGFAILADDGTGWRPPEL